MTFNIVGIFNTIVAYLVYAGLIFIGLNYWLALIADYMIGIVLGLFLNKKYTFKIKSHIEKKTIVKAILSNIVIFFINLLVLYILIDMFNYNAYISQLIALIVIAISSFVFYKFYIFKELLNDK